MQTVGVNGLSLKPVWHKLINMNGRNVATSMYFLTNRDIKELKVNSIKLISFTVNNQLMGLSLTKNRNLIKTELNLLK